MCCNYTSFWYGTTYCKLAGFPKSLHSTKHNYHIIYKSMFDYMPMPYFMAYTMTVNKASVQIIFC